MSKFNIGNVIKAKVVKILPSGAIVTFGEGESGFLHISEISRKYVKTVEDELTLNQEVEIKILSIRDGKISVSMKEVLSEEEKKQVFEDKIQKFLKDSTENLRQIQKQADKKRGLGKKRIK